MKRSAPADYLRFGGALVRPPPEELPILEGEPADPRLPLDGALVRPPPEGFPVLLGQPPPRLALDFAIISPPFLLVSITSRGHYTSQLRRSFFSRV